MKDLMIYNKCQYFINHAKRFREVLQADSRGSPVLFPVSLAGGFYSFFIRGGADAKPAGEF